MVSRKKAKGKARKAAKAKKEEEEEAHDDSSAAAAQQREQEGALEAQIQMQRLLIDSLPSPCQHGFDPFPEGDVCDRFLCLFLETCNACNGSGNKDRNRIEAVMQAMDAVEDEYPEVIYDSSKMNQILSYFLSVGTDHILNGHDDAARITAAVIVVFKECIASNVNKTKAGVCTQKLMEMVIADDHTLVSFFRKRITCSCLDKKHQEVKSIKKMGFCNNDKCPLPGGKVERSKINGARKKAKGKARKAEKAKKEEEKDAHDDSSAAVAQQREQEGSLEAQLQMQRLLIDVDSSPCKHGFDLFPEGHICDRFVRLDLDTCASSDAPTKRTGTGAGVEARVIPLIEAMSAVKDKYPEALHIFEDTAMN
ncbi:hypothetical protein QTG54_011194 [Skeletonema marinoi]|uniref:Uncharacterized protein n=1 Tax=Skeletonema marinoi TaxID=267567 RepID=A0AAD8Y335_9STRA|nr:hypothetical protein QTG54_011194 [Skeletonema marinoi]